MIDAVIVMDDCIQPILFMYDSETSLTDDVIWRESWLIGLPEHASSWGSFQIKSLSDF